MLFNLPKLNGNSISKITVILALFLVLNASSALSWTNKDLKLNELSKVSVVITDNMDDGCWTNIGEVQRYAEDSLRARDVNV